VKLAGFDAVVDADDTVPGVAKYCMLDLLKHLPRVEARAAIVSLTVGITLLGVKFAAYLVTGSTAIFADALEGIVNVTASGFAMYALVLAHRPADPEHPYGHGKIEFFSAGFEGGMILLAAVLAIGKAIDALIRHQHVRVRELGAGLSLMTVALIANAICGAYLVRAGRRQNALTLEADGWHLITDAITSAAAVTALVLVWTTGFWLADPMIAILVSFYIAATGIKLIRRSAAGLMDEQDAADNLLVRTILDSHVGPGAKEPTICSYHKLRHRHSGRYHWVDFHLVMPGQLNIETGHQTASAIEDEIEAALIEGNATAHVEPCQVKGCPNCGVPTVAAAL
jgi:cation diffusion facilitator family transporter